MLWSRFYALRSYLRSSLWIIPFISLLLYVVVIRLAYASTARSPGSPLEALGVC